MKQKMKKTRQNKVKSEYSSCRKMCDNLLKFIWYRWEEWKQKKNNCIKIKSMGGPSSSIICFEKSTTILHVRVYESNNIV